MRCAGRVMGFYILVFFGSGPIGSLLAGWMAGSYHRAYVTVLICAAFLLRICDFHVLQTPLLRNTP